LGDSDNATVTDGAASEHDYGAGSDTVTQGYSDSLYEPGSYSFDSFSFTSV
jgi:hypothetical protein